MVMLDIFARNIINTINLNNSGEASVDIYIHLLNPSSEEGRGVSKAVMSHDVMQTWKYKLCLSFDNDIDRPHHRLAQIRNALGAIPRHRIRLRQSICSNTMLIRRRIAGTVGLGQKFFFHPEINHPSDAFEHGFSVFFRAVRNLTVTQIR